MSNLDTINEAINFIEDNLANPLSVGEIADAVYYSIFHFSRMFNETTKHSPYDYLMKRRLTESAKELLYTNKKIIDIAFDYQFNNHETYTRAFKRMFGVSPMQFKKEKKYDDRIFLSKLTYDHLVHFNARADLNPEYRNENEFRFVGLMSPMNDLNESLVKLWDDFFIEIKQTSYNFNEVYYVVYYPQTNVNKYFCMIAIKIDYEINLADTSLVYKKFPMKEYAVFKHTGGNDKLSLTRDYIYQNWFPKSGLGELNVYEIHKFTDKNNNFFKDDSIFEILIPIKI